MIPDVGQKHAWITPDTKHVPSELKEGTYHMCWLSEVPTGRTQPTKVCKVAQKNGSRNASSTNPATWRPIQTALEAYETGRYDGIGRVITGPYVGTDVDDCVDPDTGMIDERGRAIINAVPGYYEYSPSGTGVKIWARDEEGLVQRSYKKPGLEIYNGGRYFTLTGAVIGEVPESIPEGGAELSALIAQEFPKPEKPTPDERLNGEHRNGDVGPSDDLDGLLAEWGVSVAKAAPDGSAKKYAVTCPFVHEHTGGDDSGTFVGQYPDGAKFFVCHHAHCAGRVFKDFAHAVMPAPVSITRGRSLQNGPRSRQEPPREQVDSTFPCTDLGNSERLVARERHRIRYCFRWGSWLIYNGVRWEPDDGGTMYRLAKATVRSIYAEAEQAADSDERRNIAKHAMASEKEARINSMISLARSEVEIKHTELDTDPYALNVLNGTLDLRTGELRFHDPADYITKVAGTYYDPAAEASVWGRHLARILPDKAVRNFVQRALGHSLSGDVSEDALFIPYGPGGNGKTVTYEAMLKVAGDYGMSAAPDLLLSKDRSHPTELADLFGARLVVSMEAEEGRRLAESLVKRLTGGDKIKARRMAENFWEFSPTHKFHMSVNHKPEVRGTDEGIWRRLKIIPFTVSIPDNEKDTRLDAKLDAELPGVLAWAVRGCVDWYQNGLKEPAAVTAATTEYRSEMDTLAAFIEARCVKVEDAIAPATQLYTQYRMWCDDAGEKKDTQKAFGMRMRERGYESRQITSGPCKGLKGWRGIGLKVDDHSPDDDDDDDGDGGNPPNPDPGTPPAGSVVDDHLPDENSVFAGNPTAEREESRRSRANSDINDLVNASRKKDVEKSSTSSTSSTPPSPAVNEILQADRPDVPNAYLVRAEDAGGGAPGLEQAKIRGKVYRLFQDPPAWLPIQVMEYVKEPQERLISPLCASVAYTLGYPSNDMPPDVRIQVERELEAECEAAGKKSA